MKLSQRFVKKEFQNRKR